MNRLTIVKIHLLLAAFIFPVALMFLVTGGFYTWGIKGSYVSEVYEIPMDEPLRADAGELETIVRRELARLGIPEPSGGAGVKTAGNSFQLEWTGADRDVLLEPTDDPATARLVVRDTTWYRHLVQLHKAKGGQSFKVYAAVLAISLLLILATGFVIAWQIPRYRRLVATASGLGVLVFFLMVGTA